MSDDLQKRVARIETLLESFFDALAATGESQGADMANPAQSSPPSAVAGSPESGNEQALAAALRRRLDGMLTWERLTPAQVRAMIDAEIRELHKAREGGVPAEARRSSTQDKALRDAIEHEGDADTDA
jgi:hypothetical protein